MADQITRKLKTGSKLLLRQIFELGQRFGGDILPRHFYSEIPNIRLLRNTTAWRSPRSLLGISGNISDQVAWVDGCTGKYRDDLQTLAIHESAIEMNGGDGGYGKIEADFLYCFVRAKRPAKIVQIGCGVSTAACLLAAKHEQYTPDILCIEPYPNDFLKREDKVGRIRLVAQKIEDAGLEFLEQLATGDFFFVDSSHTLAPAGEVNLIILELLPRLPKGMFVHFHDVHFPYDYGPDTLSSALFFQHETALLYAFLCMNQRFSIAASFSLLHHRRLDDLSRCFPYMRPRKFEDGLTVMEGHYPSSIYLAS